MVCLECGKTIPFNGQVCPYCQRDKSKSQTATIITMVFGALGAVVGYIINGVLGLIVGMFAMMVIGALIGPSASKNSKPPAVRVVEDQANILPRAVETGKASTDQQAPKISSTAEARLAHLKELLDKRLISQSEYDQKRAKIIDDI